jgi:hypothetical protein
MASSASYARPSIGYAGPSQGWSSWQSLGGVTDHAVAVGSRQPGTLDLLHIGTDGKIYLAEFE